MILQGHGGFFSLEGVDGSGKTTQIKLLMESLKALGLNPISVREPGGTPVSDQIRRILLAPENVVAPSAELLLYSAARAQLVNQVIAPALARGQVVIADRFGWSTLAYQGYGRGLDKESIFKLFEVACGPIWPRHSILLNISIEAMRARIQAEGRPADRMENENADFFERVREGYLAIAQAYPDRFTVLDGSLPPEILHSTILEKLYPFLTELELK